jgi:sec-independent protein translocase protein TatC
MGWLEAVARAAPAAASNQPITLGVAEPFTTTLRVSFYAGLLLALPLLLYQAYAFILPAFTPGERRVALPLMLMIPVLFLGGVAFGYYVVLDRAIAFLQNFNDDAFDINVQARDYYGFVIFFVGAIGLLFQVPVGTLAVTRTGLVTTQQLRRNRGYVILGIAVLAAVATPTPDPVTMTLAMGPLVVLFELSIWLATWLNRVRPPDLEPDEDLEPDDDPVATLDWDDDDRED